MNKKYFNIGESVYCPKHKLSGIIVNKYIFNYLHEKMVYYLIKVDNTIYAKSSFDVNILYTREIDGIKMKDRDYLFVNNNILKSTHPSHMYKSKRYIKLLNTLKINDIKFGNIVSFVDNNYFERVVEEKINMFDNYTILKITDLINKKLYLTGETVNLEDLDGLVYAECITNLNSTMSSKYYIPIDCLKLTKKVNIFKYFYYKLQGKC